MTLLLTLKVFSATGGIEKVCRVAGKALYEHGLEHNEPLRVFAMHGPKEAARGNRYFPAEIFTGFGSARVKFIREAVAAGAKSKTVFLSHINLLLAAWLIKRANSNVKIVLIIHGIEVWKPLSRHRRMMLKSVDEFIAVSKFTADKMKQLHGTTAPIRVINNCIDPFLAAPLSTAKDSALLSRYRLSKEDTILFTLTRLSERDRYKGYDQVIRALAELIKDNRKVKYLLAGGYDEKEKIFLDRLIAKYRVADYVILAGFIKEEELPAHFSLADIYVMPSVKEGFGIVFVEAMYYGVPAIAANVDGSVDALLNGKLGLLIEPDNPTAIAAAVTTITDNRATYIPDHELLMANFGYEEYKRKLEGVMRDEDRRRW